MLTLPPVDRVSVDDLMSLATERGASPIQVGAVLFLDSSAGLDTGAALGVLAERIRRVPRLRQRLVHVPLGYGRPAWVDDAEFDVANHPSSRVCAAPGGVESVFDVAAALLGARLPRSRPLWVAVLVTGVGAAEAGAAGPARAFDPSASSAPLDDRAALILVFHHVLADGMGGLAVMSHLVDRPAADSVPRKRVNRRSGAPITTIHPLSREGFGGQGDGERFPRGMPSRGALARDAWAGRIRAVPHLPVAVARAVGGLLALRGSIGAPRLACT